MFRIIRHEQNSPQWRRWRFDGIGASDAATVLLVNRFKTVNELLAEKSGLTAERSRSAAMIAGLSDEAQAAAKYRKRTGLHTEPLCVQHRNYEWLRASLDGLNILQCRVLEIKCGKSDYYHFQNRQSVPPWHKPQLQHILAVTGYDEIDVWCWNQGKRGILRTVKRDDMYIDKLIDAEQRFWFRVLEERQRRQEFLETLYERPTYLRQ